MKTFNKQRIASPGRIVIGSLAAVILLGAVLLWLPIAHYGALSFTDALFTATSATSVTGLLTHPLESFTPFGQAVILFLIQIGGLGLVTLSIFLVSLFFELRLSTRGITEEVFELDTWADSRNLLIFIVKTTLCAELLGTLAVWASTYQYYSLGQGLFYALFHAVSAFMTAGLSLFENSQHTLPTNVPVLCITAILVILGGLGFMVLEEIVEYIKSFHEERHFHWSLHSKLVASTTIAIITITTLLIMYIEPPAHPGIIGYLQHVSSALFNAVTCRSAGFTTFTLGHIHTATIFLLVLVSFIGSSPGSTGSGIKTTTFALFVAAIRATFTQRSAVEVKGRTIPNDQIFKAMAVLSLSLCLVAVAILCLLISETDKSFLDIFFEAFSAFSNLGLSTGITPYLSTLGKYWVILTMFVGRVGSLTLIIAFRKQKEKREFHYPEERVIIG